MSAAADRGSGTLPEGVRSRIVALAAEVLPQVTDLPASLRKVASFAPSRRGRLGGGQIWAALIADDAFRDRVATQVAAVRTSLTSAVTADELPADADPHELAAILWLTRPESWEGRYDDAVARAEELSAPREDAERERLRRRLDTAEKALRDARAEHKAAMEAIKTENASLRRKLGEARQGHKAAAASFEEAGAAAREAATRAEAATAAAEVESRRLRAQVEELQAQLASARREARADKGDTTIRARILLDTLLEAGQGLRRELGLPAVSGEPADRLEEQLAEAGTRNPSSAGALGPNSPILLEQYLSMPRARLIIDGYNVSKTAWPESSLEAQRTRLLNGLAPLVARTGASTLVVFDAAESASRPVVNAPRGVKVQFTPEGVIADDVIRDLVAVEPPGRVVIVVSSDQEVARDVLRAGARSAGASALIGLLTRGS